MRKKGMAWLLSATLAFGMLIGVPATGMETLAATTTTGDLTVTGGVDGKDYQYDSTTGKLIIKTDTALTISMNKNSARDSIYIEKDVDANITLAGVKLALSSNAYAGKAGIEIADGSSGDVKLIISGKNQIWCKDVAAIQKNGITGSLTIDDVDSDDTDDDELFVYTNGFAIDSNNKFVGYAAIGGNSGEDSGNIVFNGGTVYAVCASSGAAIGGGCYGDGSNITINGGTVNAMITNLTDDSSYKQGAAIGGGSYGNGKSITVSGGTVNAWFHNQGDTLPTGVKSYNAFSGAKYCYGGAGIGGGYSDDETGGNADNIKITGGTVTATGNGNAAGIGASCYGNATNIQITGGKVEATGEGRYAAGIGTGNLSSTSKVTDITITGGTIVAKGGAYAAGIGAGHQLSANVCISGGSVCAIAGKQPYNSKYADEIGIGAWAHGSTLNSDAYKRNLVSSKDEIKTGENNVTLSKSTFQSTPDTNLSGRLVFAYTDGTEYSYSTNGMVTDSDGYVYVWLPEGVTVSEKVSDGELIVLFNGSSSKSAWYNSAVKVTADGYTISDSENGTYTSAYTFTASGTKTLYFKGKSGKVTSQTVVIYIDSEAPTGTITLEGQSYTSVNTNTAVTRIKKSTDNRIMATISVSDAGSGILQMEYAVAEKAYTTEKAIQNANLSWNKTTDSSKSVGLSTDKNQAVYVRVTDKTGRITYLSTPLLYYDTVAPSIEGGVSTSSITATSAEYTLNFSEKSEYVYVLLKKGTSAISWSGIEHLSASNPGGKGNGTICRGTFNDLGVNTTYTLYAAAKDEVGNIGWYQGTAFTTPKKTASVASQVMTVKLNGTTTHTYDLKSMLEQSGLTVADMGNVSYSCSLVSGDVLSGVPVIDPNGIMTFTLKAGLSKADSQNIKVIFKSDNYSDITATFTVNTTTKTNVTLNSKITVPNATYDGKPHGYSGTVEWYHDSRVCVDEDQTDIIYSGIDNSYSSSIAPTNAGTYKVSFIVKSNNEDYAGTQSYSYTIQKADISYEMGNIQWYIDGTTKITSDDYTVIEDDNTHTVSLENASSKATMSKSGTFCAKSVGNYVATVTFSVSDNYYLPSNLSSWTLHWSIVEKESTGGENTGGGTGENTGSGTGENTGGETGENTGGETGENTGGNDNGEEAGTDEVTTPAAAVGDTKISGSNRYQVTKVTATGGTVAFTGATSKSIKNITIPEIIVIENQKYTVEAIAKNAFKGCTKLTSVNMPNSVKSLGSGVFNGCKALKKVKLSTNITQIPANTFNGCSKLSSITIPTKVTKLGDKAFYKCTSLKKITIPKNVKEIGKQCFFGCKKLKTVTIKTKKLKKIGSKAIKGIDKKAIIKCPNKSYARRYKKIFKSKTGYVKTMKIK